jgi:hypothetical protein
MRGREIDIPCNAAEPDRMEIVMEMEEGADLIAPATVAPRQSQARMKRLEYLSKPGRANRHEAFP